jgi:AAA+ ATPase superfamily predicted ATPase
MLSGQYIRVDEELVGRTYELHGLAQRYHHARGQLILVYGRRRIGKSFLLEHFAREKPTVFYQATQLTEEAELRAFTETVRPIVGEDFLPPGYVLPSWEAALSFVSTRYTGAKRLLVILDEFPYLAATTKGLASVVQRWWDKEGRHRNIMLVLCGSEQRFMEELDGSAAPLHQRFTAKFHVLPLSYRDAALFTPSLSAADKARVFGILGGTPLYLRQYDASVGVRENLLSLFADPASSLVDSAELVLTTDLEDAQAPYRVLQAVALGATKHNEILDRAKITTGRVIQRLIGLGLLEKRIPAGDHPEKSRRSIYSVADPYFRFYFRFIAMHRGVIDRGLGGQLIDNVVLPNVDQYMGCIFEDIARDFARELLARGELTGEAVGSWWSTDGHHEIDIVGTTGRRPTFVGSVKWREAPLGEALLRDLDRSADALGIAEDCPRLLVGREGIVPELVGRPGVRGISADDMYA